MAILRKLPAAVAVAALTVTLYGCGGSNRIDDLDEAFGGTATAEDITTLREGEAAAKAAAVKSSAAEATAKAAETAAKAAETAAKAAEVEAKRLQGVAEKEASTNAATATTANEAAAKAQEAATAARNEATTARNEATTARNEATAEANRANAADAALAKLQGDIARLKRIAEAAGLSTAIDAEVITPPITGTDAPADWPTGTESITAERDKDGMVTVTAKATEPNDYAGGMSQASADDPWTQTMSTRSHLRTSSEDTLTVYTDIAVPTATKLTLNDNNFVSAARGGDTNLPIALTTKPSSDPDDAFGPINSLIMLSGLKAEPDNNYEIGTDGVTGSYRDIAGTFLCDGDCNVKSDTDGDLTAAGNVHFRPNNIADTYLAQDSAYTWFGWWLRKNSSGVPTAAEVFSGGIGPLNGDAIQDVTRTATYVGAAAGKFSVGHYTAGKQTDADAGHFDADVSLSARFGDAATDYGSINGAVTNFVLYGSGETDATGWQVTMTAIPVAIDASATERAADDFTPGQNINGTGRFGGHTDVTFGGSPNLNAGAWEGSFYGAAKNAADAPGTAAGTFSAGISGAAVIGAFGAHKKP